MPRENAWHFFDSTFCMLVWSLLAPALGLTRTEQLVIGASIITLVIVTVIVLVILWCLGLACWSEDSGHASREATTGALIPPYFLTPGTGDPLGQEDI